MATENTCRKCGAPLGDDARQGFCPKCLFLQASTGLLDQELSEVSSQLSVVSRQRAEGGVDEIRNPKSEIRNPKSVR